MTISHNFGVAYSTGEMALCHSIWCKEQLVIVNFWSNDSISLEGMLNQIGSITSRWNRKKTHHCHFYAFDEIFKARLSQWLESQPIPHAAKVLEPIGNPKSLPSNLMASIQDERIEMTAGIDRDAVEQALHTIGADDKGRAIGDARALALLFGVGEPLYRRETNTEERIREHPAKIYVGKTRDTIRTVSEFTRLSNGDWWGRGDYSERTNFDGF